MRNATATAADALVDQFRSATAARHRGPGPGSGSGPEAGSSGTAHQSGTGSSALHEPASTACFSPPVPSIDVLDHVDHPPMSAHQAALLSLLADLLGRADHPPHLHPAHSPDCTSVQFLFHAGGSR
ncbi:hypothetical protein BBK82_16545 [Lentzea guizhouensis]|uniref:Uncharacterized protein n=1 Tax=Lentzea guizhouensis TaxID=1586287 RepID=A0A1B2HI70_9PSEU|nr:hypothetical protein [Lentzea guizhouensis]ANZ37424.1 hypothetical protein BBK82_16545 [Lentzea guizhouensis]